VPYTPYPEDWCDRPVIEVIGEVARRRPAHIAIDDGAYRLTYAQVYAMACRLGNGLDRAGLPPGPIGIQLSYDALHPIAILGCLAAGRPSLPLNPNNPPDYNRRVIEAAGLAGVLVNAAAVRELPASGARAIAIEPLVLSGADADVPPPANQLGPDAPAFIVSTSGSTGTPKLLARSQRRLHQGARTNIDIGHFNQDDRFVNLGAAANGSSVSRNFVALLLGASVHIVDIPRAGMGGILRVLRDERITVVQTTVSLMKALAQLDDARAHLTSLRMMWVGGEPLLQKDLAGIRAALPPECRLGYSLNMTETRVARWCVPEIDEHDLVRVAAGYPVAGTDVLVVDDDGRPCSAGEVGELIVRSESVALGEWRDGRLLPDLFQRDAENSAKRIYRTGDMVRICADGVLVVHGRKDRMIKIRGQRVEPAIIETAMRAVPGVADATVTVRQSEADVRLYGFVAPGPSAAGDLRAVVQAALNTVLPHHMRPSDVFVLDGGLPLNASGKVDIAALSRRISAPGAARPAVVASVPAAANDPASRQSRERVAKAWRAAFDGESSDPTLSFDRAGGDSLQFMQLVFRLEQLCGMTLPLGAFALSMTQTEMTQSLDRFLGGNDAPLAEGKPVFFVPGLGGDEPRLLSFRAGCAPDFRFRCLEYGDWTQWVQPGFRFEMLVDRMVREIQEMAPSGPLTLAGYSLGGQVALAVAARLHACGRQIEHVLILDSTAIGSAIGSAGGEARTASFEPPPTRRQEFAEWRAARRRGEGAFALAHIATRRLVSPRWAPLLRWLARHRRSVLRGRIDFYISFHLHRSWLAQLASEWRARLTQVPWLPAPITLFRTDHGADLAAWDTAAWRVHSPRVTVVPVGGDHFTMFDPPHLADLCARFRGACAAVPAQEIAAS
jgi:acyl-coenzyme A synthetase/AMP-(fatty) acid ligase/thioesterase domain-containing protein